MSDVLTNVAETIRAEMRDTMRFCVGGGICRIAPCQCSVEITHAVIAALKAACWRVVPAKATQDWAVCLAKDMTVTSYHLETIRKVLDTAPKLTEEGK